MVGIILMVIVLIIHLILCLALILLKRSKKTKVHRAMYPLMFLVIIFGPLCALLLNKHYEDEDPEIIEGLDKFQIENAIYKSIGLDTDDTEAVALEEALLINDGNVRRNIMMEVVKDNIIPLEDALAVGSNEVRRKIMLDVLNNDVSAFYDLMKYARMNDDVEVVHYATTAMTELNKQYDAKLVKYLKQYKDNPTNVSVLKDYCDCLKRYLGFGFIKGQLEENRKQELIGLLKQLVEAKPELESFNDLVSLLIETEQFDEAEKYIDIMFSKWPMDEATWLARIELYVHKKDRDGLNEIILEAKKEHIYFSEKARKQIEFWT